jgi:hypothetical protein
MDHFKLLELDFLKRFAAFGNIMEVEEFGKVFPDGTTTWMAVFQGLDKSYASYDMTTIKGQLIFRYYLHELGRLRIIQLEKELKEEEDAKNETKEVSAWTIVAGIGAVIAAVPVIIEFVKWLIS